MHSRWGLYNSSSMAINMTYTIKTYDRRRNVNRNDKAYRKSPGRRQSAGRFFTIRIRFTVLFDDDKYGNVSRYVRSVDGRNYRRPLPFIEHPIRFSVRKISLPSDRCVYECRAYRGM